MHKYQLWYTKDVHACELVSTFFCVMAWLSAPAEDWHFKLQVTVLLVPLQMKFQDDRNPSLLMFFISHFLNHSHKSFGQEKCLNQKPSRLKHDFAKI